MQPQMRMSLHDPGSPPSDLVVGASRPRRFLPPDRCRVCRTRLLSQVNQDRAELAAAPERKIVDAKVEDGSRGQIGESHDAAQDRLACGVDAQPGSQRVPPLPQVANPIAVICSQ